MGQQFQKIRAKTLDEAYRVMRRQFGLDAIVVSTRHVNAGGLFGFFGERMVEITASVPTPDVRSAPRRPSAVERKYASQRLPEELKRSLSMEHYERIVREAQKRMNGEAPGGAETLSPAARAFESLPETPPRPAHVAAPPGPAQAAPAASAAAPAAAPAESPVVPFRKPTDEPSAEVLRREVREIREMLQVLYSESPGAGLPTEFAPYYRMLVNRGVSRKVAAQLLGAVLRDSDPGVLRNGRIFEERLKLEIRKRVRVTGGLAVEAGTRRVVVLCGPTGVGKTTNLAKLAALYTVRERARVALLTADTYRIAAPEQLRVYANIIGLPLRVVNDLKELGEALHDMRRFDLVFMDTAGNSQFNLEQINELKSLLQEVQPYETVLTMSANTHLEDLRSVVSNFKCLNPTSVLFTKIDETRQYGAMLSILVEASLPLSYISVGQNVPDDIRVASTAHVANLVMEGRESRG
ncbi:MAG: flagellar biosynthesis protein FlhF [Candidatus Hydrogenedentes bacterium]|nr:flagellar biosynthesis protein FlhF [Candidatus Hydrogenedentota bacterium]